MSARPPHTSTILLELAPRVDACRDLAASVVAGLRSDAGGLGSAAIERATLQLIVLDATLETEAGPVVIARVIVDHLRSDGILGHGALVALANAFGQRDNRLTLPELARAVARGELRLGSLPVLPGGDVGCIVKALARQAIRRVVANRNERDRVRAVLGDPRPHRALVEAVVGTSHPRREVVAAQAAVEAGADVIVAIDSEEPVRSETVQSGASEGGRATHGANRERLRRLRAALDDAGRGAGRFVRLFCGARDRCGPEGVALAARERVDGISSDYVADVLSGGLDPLAALVDQDFAQYLAANARIALNVTMRPSTPALNTQAARPDRRAAAGGPEVRAAGSDRARSVRAPAADDGGGRRGVQAGNRVPEPVLQPGPARPHHELGPGRVKPLSELPGDDPRRAEARDGVACALGAPRVPGARRSALAWALEAARGRCAPIGAAQVVARRPAMNVHVRWWPTPDGGDRAAPAPSRPPPRGRRAHLLRVACACLSAPMRAPRSHAVFAAMLVLSAGAAAGCGCERSGARTAEFRIALAALPTTLDWSRGHTTSWSNYPVLQAMMRGLVAVDARNAVVPDLAESWEIRTLPGPERKPEYTFHLRRDVVWSDGVTPLTARDFVAGLHRALRGAQASELSDVDGAAAVAAASTAGDLSRADALARDVGIEAIDDFTLRIRLAGPRAYFLARVAGLYTWYPAPSRALEGLSPEQTARYFDEPREGSPAVLGPYRVASWDRLAQVIRLERNPSYQGRAPVDRLVLVTSALAELLYDRGKIAFLLFDDPAALSRPPPDLQRQELLSTYWLGLNAETVPLALRQAIAHAVDRPRLLQGLVPHARPAFGYLPDDLPGAVRDGDPRAVAFPRYDPARARALVRQAGYDGRELTLLVRGTQTFLPERGIADALRRQLAEVGIRVRYELSRNFVEDLVRPNGSTRPDLFLRRIGADYAHPETFFSIFGPGGNDYTALDRADPASDAALQAGLQRARAELDPERSRALYADAQEALLARSAVVVPLYYPDRYFRCAPGVEGLRVDPFNLLTFRDMRVAGEGR